MLAPLDLPQLTLATGHVPRRLEGVLEQLGLDAVIPLVQVPPLGGYGALEIGWLRRTFRDQIEEGPGAAPLEHVKGVLELAGIDQCLGATAEVGGELGSPIELDLRIRREAVAFLLVDLHGPA